jgi:hypothetical protein
MKIEKKEATKILIETCQTWNVNVWTTMVDDYFLYQRSVQLSYLEMLCISTSFRVRGRNTKHADALGH